MDKKQQSKVALLVSQLRTRLKLPARLWENIKSRYSELGLPGINP